MEREGEREREEWINGVRDGVLDINGSNVGQKWLLGKTPEYFCNENQ